MRAISGNAWFSLGRHGVGLHFERRPGRTSEVVVLKRPGARAARCGRSRSTARSMDRFSRMEEAVQAVDYEIDRMGRAAAASALDSARWRFPKERCEALRLAVWKRVVGR